MRGSRDEPLTNFVEFLIRRWLERQEKATGKTGSMRALAAEVGVAPNAPHQILAGTLGVSGGTVHRWSKWAGYATTSEFHAAAAAHDTATGGASSRRTAKPAKDAPILASAFTKLPGVLEITKQQARMRFTAAGDDVPPEAWAVYVAQLQSANEMLRLVAETEAAARRARSAAEQRTSALQTLDALHPAKKPRKAASTQPPADDDPEPPK